MCIKIIIGFHLLNILLWTIGQGGAVISYNTVAEWGLQDPRELIDPVIVEVNRAIGLADMIIMIPLFLIAVIGLWRQKFWGAVFSWFALGITFYWPVVFFCSQYFYGHAGIKYQPTQLSAIVILTVILIFTLWASWYLVKYYKKLD
ncbi:MAG: hypothetical protein K8R86_11405 [Bacteroidales bacterium]|nr:hypothetical protein [Bacteroidales bacterium]